MLDQTLKSTEIAVDIVIVILRTLVALIALIIIIMQIHIEIAFFAKSKNCKCDQVN